jgi:hypothetical protein
MGADQATETAYSGSDYKIMDKVQALVIPSFPVAHFLW